MLRQAIAAACLLVVGCTSGPPPLANASVLDCGTFIDTQPPHADFEVVLGVVGLPASPRYPALQIGPSGGDGATPRLFAKTGLVVRAGTSFEVITPDTDRFGVGWGGNLPAPAQRVVVPGCPAPGGADWLDYAGGYWIDHPACVRILVRAGGAEQPVEVGLGTPCPGQQPPAQP